MTELDKKVAELRLDEDFADCSEDELIEVARMELGAKAMKLVVSGDKRDRKTRTPKEDIEKTKIIEKILVSLKDLGYEPKQTKQGEIEIDNLSIKIIRHRKVQG